MPQPGLPLTPASSTDLLARDNAKSTIASTFSLGPPAIHSAESSASSNASVKSDSSYRPTSSSSSRKRPRQEEDERQQEASVTAVDYSLPPPPTRSRRIIQMKPAGPQPSKQASVDKSGKKKTATHSRTNSTTTAAGKKTARKTAHSIIERRRRSKMNEEFETLKNMIPACNGQQMHKLAILQAGIDYMRYLEQCVTDLKSANRESQLPVSIPQSQAPTPRPQSVEGSDSEEDENDEQDDDVEMNEAVATIPEASRTSSDPRTTSQSYGSYQSSPIVHPQTSRAYQYAASSTSSTLPSPAFGPRNDSWSSMDRGRLPYNLSADTSPAILPQIAQDAEEASAALLMLNHDRRYSRSDRPTGLSVKDLLSN